MIRVAIIGAAGLSGLELIHWLRSHPQIELSILTSSKYAGQTLEEVFPKYTGMSQSFEKHDANLDHCDAAFLAIPNKASLDLVPALLEKKIRVVDLSGVYRLNNTSIFEKYYGLTHTSPNLLETAVFGLPEYFKDQICEANLIANPGCYPTGALLGMLPFGNLLENLSTAPILDAKSGVSGAGGRVEDDTTNYVTVNENFKAYKIFNHQHTPEIEQYLAELTGYSMPQHGSLTFTPHLLPLNRGILTTIYLRFHDALPVEHVRQSFEDTAQSNPFMHVLPQGHFPDLAMVQNTNYCRIGIAHDDSRKNWIVVTTIDNLVKGAAGQAIQNMNLMFGLDESTGLI
ncbi:MAG: N-acetyl-gamma-glutamyl-phosphate reductase [SAR324 cluster bacterium]|nr:N-acetyl-gamma-glutamyl-phosphate reductase [SAR324 cluster bacterium]